MDLGLRGRVAIVTGASRGIGRQVARDLAAEGCDIMLCGRDEAALAEAVTDVGATGARATAVAIDLADSAAAPTIVERCVAELGRVDILINNAGGGAAKRLETLTDEDWRAGFEVNFFAAARLATACLPEMRSRGWGRIISISSTYGREPDPVFGPYAAAKAALLNLSKNLSQAFSAEGVLSNCVVPGVTLTELVARSAEGAAAATGTTAAEVMEKMMAKHPVAAGRFGSPSEVAAAVVFLASERSSWITGAAVAVDGGTMRAC